MEIHIHIHDHREKEILNKLNLIIMKNEELLAKLDSANAKTDKIITEIQALKELVKTTPDVPQNIVDAVNTLESKLQTADDLNEDAG
jgi:hypothetical protein